MATTDFTPSPMSQPQDGRRTDLKPEMAESRYGLSIAASTPEDLDRIKDLFATQGALGIPEEEVLGPVNRLMDSALSDLNKDANETEKHAIEEAKDVYSQLARAQELATLLRQKFQDLQQKKFTINRSEQSVAGEIRGLTGELIQHRARNGAQSGGRIARQILEETESQDLERIKADHEAEKSRFGLAKEVWDLNTSERNRHVSELQAEQALVEQRLNRIESLLNALRTLGVTRTTSGFLSWAGYIIMAGAAYAVTQILYPRQAPGSDPISGALAGMSARMGTIHGFSDLWLPLVHLCGVLFGGLLVVAVFSTLMGLLLRLARPTKMKAARLTARRRRSPLAAVKAFFGGETLFRSSRRPRVRRQSDDFDYQMPSYSQVIAMLPWAITLTLFLFFISGLGLRDAAAQFPTPYVSVAIALGMAAVSIMYNNFVLGPRLRDFLLTEATPRVLSVFRWEARILSALLIIAIALCGSLPAGPMSDRICWSAVAIFLLLTSLPFACGILQKGLFRDYLELEDKRNFYRARIDTCLAAPLMRDINEGRDPADDSDDWKPITREKLLELEVIEAIQQRYQPDFADDESFQRFSDGLARYLGFEITLPRSRVAVEPESILAAISVPDELINRFRELQIRRAEVQSDLSAISEELVVAQAELSRVEAKIDELDRRQCESGLRLIELRRDFDIKRQKLSFYVERLRAEYREAYVAGRAARESQQNRTAPDFQVNADLQT